MYYKLKKRKRNKKRVSKNSKISVKKKNKYFSLVKNLLLLIISLFLIVITIILIWFLTLDIPNIKSFEERKISNSTKIYDRTGDIILYDIHGEIQRTVVSGDKISEHVKNAVIAIEDHNFYKHKGVVIKSILRAVLHNTFSKLNKTGTQGGSTITQQVVKNTILNPEKKIERKMKELVLALKLEQILNKEAILTSYLNESPYGGTIYGIQEASKRFFGKNADEVSLAEAAYLAAIPNRPTYYSPYGNNKEELEKRKNLVLREMKKYNFIDDEEYENALKEKIVFKTEKENSAKALHFVQYIREYLEKKYGNDMIENGGLQVITTLNYDLQKEAEVIILENALKNEKNYDASNAGLIAIDPKTGEIITMVGSRNYFNEEIDGNYNVTLAKRQPGSAFKPIAYATAFERGYFPESIIFDTPTQFNASCEAYDLTSKNNCYAPRNYDRIFKGDLTFRNSLAQSRNVSSIKILYLAGLENTIKQAKVMGISSLNESPYYYGLTLVLGGGEVSLLELTSAYGVFGNDGVYNKPTGILEIKDLSGLVLETHEKDSSRVLNKNSARMISDILSDNEARIPLFGANSFLNFGKESVAGKTGTTNDNRDAWLIGFTPTIAIGVWSGNNDNSKMMKGSSISGAPWREFMDIAIKEMGKEYFKPYKLPDDFTELPPIVRGVWSSGTFYIIDSETGKLATEFTPEETKIEIPIMDPHTILHWIDKNNPMILNSNIKNSDPQYENWEFGVQTWINQNYPDIRKQEIEIPDGYDDLHTSEVIPNISIKSDIEDKIYKMHESIEIEIEILENKKGEDENKDEDEERDDKKEIESTKIIKVDYYINNIFSGSSENYPFAFSFIPENISNIQKNNTIKAIAIDENFNRGEDIKVFKIDL